MLVMSHYSALKYVLKRGTWGTWLGNAHHCPSPRIAGDGNHGAPQVFTCPYLGLVPLRGRLCPAVGACALPWAPVPPWVLVPSRGRLCPRGCLCPDGAWVNPGIEGRKA